MPSTVTKAVIPAAGLGTRFLPATKAVPKEMLPIVDTPTIQLVVDEAARAGIRDVVLINGRGKGAIEDHFDHAYELEHTLRARGLWLATMAFVGFTFFNICLYAALHFTTAVNSSVQQASMPAQSSGDCRTTRTAAPPAVCTGARVAGTSTSTRSR